MNSLKITLLLIFFFKAAFVYGQDLPTHRWKDRLIMVLTSDTSLSAYQDQIAIFDSDVPGMKERKLVLYKITPDQYQVGNDNHHWIGSGSLYERFRRTDADLEIILIGLDGTIKLRRSETIALEDLYAAIDAMPMRQREMKLKK